MQYVYAILVNEPFGLRLQEIAELTDRQIREIYFWPRDEHGRLVSPRPTPPRRPLTEEEARLQFFAMARSLGTKEEVIEQQWRKQQARRLAAQQASSATLGPSQGGV